MIVNIQKLHIQHLWDWIHNFEKIERGKKMKKIEANYSDGQVRRFERSIDERRTCERDDE